MSRDSGGYRSCIFGVHSKGLLHHARCVPTHSRVDACNQRGLSSRTPHILQACHMTASASSASPILGVTPSSSTCNISTCACEMCPLRSTLFLGCHPLASASLNGRPHRSTLNPSHFLLAAAVLPSIEGPLPPKTALGSAPTADQGSAICDRSLSSRGDGDGARAVDTTQRIPQRIPQ